MKYITASIFMLGIGIIGLVSCDKENPAETIEGNYSGVISGVYQGQDTLAGNGDTYPVYATAITRNKIEIQGSLFSTFEVLVTEQGINVDPVSTDENVYEFLYQGDLKELSFKYYKDGDSAYFVGHKP